MILPHPYLVFKEEKRVEISQIPLTFTPLSVFYLPNQIY